MLRSIHPFPARMAPDLALAELGRLGKNSLILDPMAGSGTVLRQAAERGLNAIGVDMDPLAVLISKVWTTPVSDALIEKIFEKILIVAQETNLTHIVLEWIDGDEDTLTFIDYWFGREQKDPLRRISYAMHQFAQENSDVCSLNALNVLKVALSRIVITKDRGASLARDVSHSRPHKVVDCSTFEVFPAFQRSVRQVRKLLLDSRVEGKVDVGIGDARALDNIVDNSIDFVLTSPPYLNAIDYMRGHRLSLVWLGYRLSELRHIRSNSVGAERAPDSMVESALSSDVQHSMVDVGILPRKHQLIVARYAADLVMLMSEVARVLKSGARATLVVGNSCLRGAFISNSNGIIRAASLSGLQIVRTVERKLPENRRYLPTPLREDTPLGKRMRTETIITFASV